jgi:hypothetical protein
MDTLREMAIKERERALEGGQVEEGEIREIDEEGQNYFGKSGS